MLSLSLLTLGLATIGAYSNPTIRAPGGLEISLSTPANTVTSVSEIRVVAVVKNVGDDDLTIRKFGTVLDNRETTRSFIVTKDGDDVPFTGFKALFSTDSLSENDLVTVVPAGKTVVVEHNVSAVYDFFVAGSGTFTFHPVSKFQVIGTNNTIEANIARSVSITVIDVSKRELDLEPKIPSFRCKGEHNKTLRAAYWEARVMANYAIINIERKGPDDSHYKKYFGKNNYVNVMANFVDIVSPNNPHDFACDDYSCFDEPYHYFGTNGILFCQPFFSLLRSKTLCVLPARMPRETRGGAMLIAMSPPYLKKDDKTCDEAKALLDPEKFTTAANYACYAAMTYGLYTDCSHEDR